MYKTTFRYFPRLIIGLFGAIVMIGLVTLFLKLGIHALQIQIIALLYLLPILICTILWGLTSGILAGLLAFLAFNYFFIQPYYTLRVHQSQDLITLVIFLIVAGVLSQFVGQAREAVLLAKKREWEATRMYELISALAGLNTIQNVMHILADKMSETFRFDRIEISANDRMAGQTLSYATQTGNKAETPCDLTVSMSTSRNTEGEIKLWLDQEQLSVEESRLLKAFANQGALAIERIHLFNSENLAKVLAESDRIKTSLLNSVSHELRSPLAVIKASVSSLRSGAVGWDSSARGELLATVEEETDQLNLLVGNLLDMSRIEAGALQPKIQWNSIVEIIKSVAAKMSSQLKHYKLEYHFDQNLPFLPTDFVMMGQVFTNLFSNSTKYAPSGSAIVISAARAGSEVLIKIVNQSPHVPEEHLAHIFDKFFRVTESDKVTGTGLGLSICKGIVEAHGGKIWAENQKDGFAFLISLPTSLDGSYPDMPKELIDG